MKVEWSNKIKVLKKGFLLQNLLNLKKDSLKLKNLRHLKYQSPAERSSNCQEVELFMKKTPALKAKNGRLYREVYYPKKHLPLYIKLLNFFKSRINEKNLPGEEFFELNKSLQTEDLVN